MRELNRSVNTTARLLCRLVTTHKDLACLFSPAHLQFILQSGGTVVFALGVEFVDDDVCLLLASSFNQSYVSKSPRCGNPLSVSSITRESALHSLNSFFRRSVK